MPDGFLASSVGKILGTGEGRGIGLLILLSGLCVIFSSFLLSRSKSVKKLEHTHV
jgi:hypothetical protein